ncbi:Twitching mobility protein [Serratia entomophila]|uniref:plasmid transfer ATPase TraJ n=1 Tax=Serratia TaxID=613 RepID=UPI001F4C4C45|nr:MULTISPECIES: plasmid transfer ATPase TraJ [Serratia]ULG11208.1 plasmid transfer ATPase TraJ [Serratia entomophila]ULG18154.1 plasmid transfer ATPase TraJ [Serratia proteamaculans]ULG19059.1 plasmid transfer ATPase TraJ [Serratia proteamaculans]CAI1179695.1 Twitching mobility protein [Serratia entomophila]CAI2154930.1 Twitching mobility protein [Serratia entomophila]
MTESTDFVPYPFESGLDGNALKAFFVWCAKQNVSDIHIQGGNHLVVSHHGRLRRASTFVLADDTLSKLIDEVFEPEVRATAGGGHPVDRALQLDGDMYQRYGLDRGERLRFRCNFVQATAGRLDTTIALTMRIIPTAIPDLDSLGIEDDLRSVVLPHKGLAFIGGETGSGKSTFLASVYRHCIDHDPDRKVTTTEDPIEFVLGKSGDILPATQLQIRRDVANFAEGIRADLRRAPSVIGVGEMRDRETVEAGIQAGQLGHLCLSTLHIHSPGEAIPRCLNLFQAEIREAIAHDMLGVLQYIVVQKLLRTTDGKRQAVREYIIFDDPLRERLSQMPYIKWGQHIDGIIRTEKRRIADHAWRLYLQGRIAHSELAVALTSHQLRELERGHTHE